MKEIWSLSKPRPHMNWVNAIEIFQILHGIINLLKTTTYIYWYFILIKTCLSFLSPGVRLTVWETKNDKESCQGPETSRHLICNFIMEMTSSKPFYIHTEQVSSPVNIHWDEPSALSSHQMKVSFYISNFYTLQELPTSLPVQLQGVRKMGLKGPYWKIVIMHRSLIHFWK